MHLRSLELNNYEGHEHLIINFDDGVNVVMGASDVGKSSVRRAIEWLCFGYNYKNARKTGTKQTSVKGVWSDGKTIERTRSASINRYTLTIGDTDRVFDAIGKSAPDEIRQTISIIPIIVEGEEIFLNTAPQLSLPFLFERSPSFRSKLFNQLSGSEVLDTLTVGLNKDSLRINRELKELEEKLPNQKEILDLKEMEKEKAEHILEKAKRIFEVVEKQNEELKILQNLIKDSEENKSGLLKVGFNLSKLVLPQPFAILELKDKIEAYNVYKTNIDTLKTLQDRASLNKELNKVIEEELIKIVEIPSINLDEIRQKIEGLTSLNTLLATNEKNKATLDKNNVQSDNLENELFALEEEKIHLLKQEVICPTCGKEI